jgi:DNA-binding GntR family transcriptional regulator
MQTTNLENAINALREEIQHGVFVPGQRLVESDLMEHLDITRGKVREVFRHLQAEGLVNIEKNRGAIVRKITRKELSHITEVLEDISVLMLRKIGKQLDERKTQKNLKDLLKITRQFRIDSTEISTVQAYMEENARFWGALAELAENPVLYEIRLRLQSQLFRFASEGLIVSRDKDKWITLHEDIVSSLLKEDVGHAVRYARKSMAEVWDAISSLPDRAFAK